MHKLAKFIIPAFAAACLLQACNAKSSEDSSITIDESSSVAVTGFYIKNNKKVLDSLENVFFSIDLDNALIFNADSMPYGTNVTHLIPCITIAASSEAKLEFPRPGQSDSISDYLKNPEDSIDFSNGPVKLRVRSKNGAVERVYSISVNVHKVKPDTLTWAAMQSAELPVAFDKVSATFTACAGDKYLTLSANADNSKYAVATTADPSAGDWSVTETALPFAADVESLRATADAFFILDNDGNLYTGTDGISWQATGEQWSYIYGAYGNQIVGCREEGGSYSIVTYPGGTATAAPAGFPVSDTSLPVVYSGDMAFAPSMVIVGGIDAQGNYSNASWGFDGTEWAKLTSTRPLPKALAQPTLVAYDIFQVTSSTWTPEQYPAIIAMGGVEANGNVNRTVYYSCDFGMTWRTASELMQMPAEVESFYAAPAFVYTSVMYPASRAGGFWRDIALRAIPCGARLMGEHASRVDKPLTQWDCPAIYVFGGRNASADVIPALWRARILRYTFEPVQ